MTSYMYTEYYIQVQICVEERQRKDNELRRCGWHKYIANPPCNHQNKGTCPLGRQCSHINVLYGVLCGAEGAAKNFWAFLEIFWKFANRNAIKVVFGMVLVEISQKFRKKIPFFGENTSTHSQKFWDTSTQVVRTRKKSPSKVSSMVMKDHYSFSYAWDSKEMHRNHISSLCNTENTQRCAVKSFIWKLLVHNEIDNIRRKMIRKSL